MGAGQLKAVATSASEKSLVSAAKAGCHKAYAELRTRQGSRVYSVVRRITRNHEDAEDVLQETWIRGFLHIASFDEKANFSTWITRIAINCALMSIRKHKRHVELSIDDEGDTSLVSSLRLKSLIPDPEECLLALERHSRFQEAVRGLPFKLRQVAEKRISNDCSLKEVANTSGVTVPVVKYRLLRAKRRIKLSLEQQYKSRQ